MLVRQKVRYYVVYVKLQVPCLTFLCCLIDQTIHIDVEFPGDQGEGVFVFMTNGLKHQTKEYKAYIVELVVDHRDIQEYYSLSFVEGSSEAVLSKPVFLAHYRMDTENDWKFPSGCEFADKAYAMARAKFAAEAANGNPDYKCKNFKLIFPSDFKLSQKVFRNGALPAENGLPVKANWDMVTYKKGTGLQDSAHAEVYQLQCRICWMFVNLASARVVEVAGATSGAASTIRNAFAGMS